MKRFSLFSFVPLARPGLAGALAMGLTHSHSYVLQQFCDRDSPPQFCFKVVGKKTRNKKLGMPRSQLHHA